jgi:polysaccharide biosynthesis/export protein
MDREGILPVNFSTVPHRHYRDRSKSTFITILIIAAGMLLGQCTPPPQQEAFLSKPGTPPSVTLTPGDVVDVKFYYTPEMDESQTIRPDGKISVQLLGDVDVAGKTPEQIRQELITAYSNHLKNPDVVVIVRSFNERRVYVGGEVNRPGVVPIPGSLTVLEAIMDAGGFNMASAKPQNVVILRRQGEKWQGKVVNLSKPLKGDTDSLCELGPRDIVYVPRTNITKVDQWIDQHINKIIPEIVTSAAGAFFSAEFYRELNNTK